MSEETDLPVKVSVKSGLSPVGAIILLVIGVGMIIPGIINIPFIGITIMGICIAVIGVLAPIQFYKFTRLPSGLQYQRRYKTFFFPFDRVQNVLWDFKPIKSINYYQNGSYSGSRAFARVRVVIVMPTEQVPIEVTSFVKYNKNKVAPDPKSLEVKVTELRDQWMQVLSKPTN